LREGAKRTFHLGWFGQSDAFDLKRTS